MTFKHLTALAAGLAMAFGAASVNAAERVNLNGGAVDVYTAPQDDITMYVVDFISKNQRRVWVAAYVLTHPDIARAIAQAKARGLDVRVVLDAKEAGKGDSGATYLRNSGVPIWLHGSRAIMHHTFIVGDDERVGFGSASFTKAAMNGRKGDPLKSNAENFNLFVGVPALNKQYAAEFERLVAESSR